MQVISRKEARQKGLIFYFTDKYCKNRHIAKRYVVNGTCLTCTQKWDKKNKPKYRVKQAARSREYYKNHTEERKAYSRKYAKENAAVVAAKLKAYQEKHKERYKKLHREYKQKNKERQRLQHRLYRQANAAKYTGYKKQRKLQTIQSDYFKVFQREILQFYSCRPVGHHVDHITPLRHKDICGLHVPWNLQYLPAAENIRKNNKFTPYHEAFKHD